MSREIFIPKTFKRPSLEIIAKAEEIITEYQAAGFVLTLRQLYYQFVARDILPNKQSEYKRLGSIIDDAKLAGLLPWAAIEDRTRRVEKKAAWTSAATIVEACADQFHMHRWQNQRYAPEVWIEKEALVGVIEGICNDLDIPYFACRGYVSGSAQWRAGKRAAEAVKAGRQPIIFHLGDHDPSGLDMTRDNFEKINLFARQRGIKVRRLALNRAQIDEYDPPPNPAKDTDARFSAYAAEHGESSWELDALEPRVIAKIIADEAETLIDRKAWDKIENKENIAKRLLNQASEWIADQENA